MDSQMYCRNCGAALSPGVRFCGSCGQPVAAAPESTGGFGPPEAQPSTPPAPWDAAPAQTPPPPPPEPTPSSTSGAPSAGPFIPTSSSFGAPPAGGGYTPPSGGANVPPKKKSKTGLYVGIGCLALVVLVACVAVALALAPKILDRGGGSVSMATAVVPPREGSASATATPRSGGVFGGGGASGTIATPAAPSDDGIARGELLYSDDFADGESGWDIREADDASTVYQNGAYHIIVNDIDWVAWGNPYSYFADFVVDVDATQVSGPDDNDFGVLVRYVDVDNFYRFEISGDGYYSFDLMQDDEWVTLINWTESPAIRQGEATNTITIVCEGDLFTFYVNGEYLDEYRDGTFPSGDIGLLAGTISDGPVHIAFDNVKVWSLP